VTAVTSPERDHHKPKTTLFMEEKLRKVARGATRRIATHRGASVGMWNGVGYPKSGTVWLCKQLGTSLGLPVPLDYQMPIMMQSVIHSHWMYDERFGPSVYIRRDGRDVVASMYFHWTRGLRMKRDPKYAARLQEIFDGLYGKKFDPEDAVGNMPKYIEYQMTVAPTTHGVTWQQHIRDWWEKPQVGHVSYENLLSDPVPELAQAIEKASGKEADRRLIEIAVQRHAFASETGRKAGQENRDSFLRKGIAGDWVEHFSREAGEVFDQFAGQDLIDFGYATDREWWKQL
jgi:Sulfotransferase domain